MIYRLSRFANYLVVDGHLVHCRVGSESKKLRVVKGIRHRQLAPRDEERQLFNFAGANMYISRTA